MNPSLSYLLLFLFITTTFAAEEVVKDATGKKVLNNVRYHIGPVSGKGGAIKLTDTINKKKFVHSTWFRIPTMKLVGACEKSTFWTILDAEAAKAPSNLITTGGPFEEDITCFQVVNYPKPTNPKVHSYMLQHCPAFCGGPPPFVCYNVSVVVDKGVRRLASAGTNPFEFVFHKPAQSATPLAASTSIVNAPSENMYNQATSNLVAGSNLEERAIEYLYSVNPSAQLPQAAQPAAVPSAGPNVNPLDLFPRGLPDMGANASIGAPGNLDFLHSILLISRVVCKPKKFGGLGLKNLKDWNEALLAKHIWNIASKKDTLWVKWVHMMRLKDASIWNVEYNANDSWNWQCLLEVRDKIANRLKYEIGDGNNIHIWQDNWHSSGLLINQISNRDLYDAGVPKKYSLADMIDNGN
uniref:RNA-directed DNA polymerase, eukaryota, reverse transcriptase zinc-binding domain protein n=1 Tax=Tanacetum cinerariifolium TaxID=118510 RepID=A0A699HCV4_TANCI|nr:RNA-directed DNA polymerase, eukaryota, reverse transcriptase zinc-binding domain protein [Tanacetum cinerariifolium]